MSNALSREKITESIREFETEFDKWDVMRNVFKTVKYVNFKIQNIEDFVRVGYSQIIPRNFFIDFTGDTYYDNKGIGSNYGKGIASGETKYILNILENKIDKEDEKQCDKKNLTSYISTIFYTYPDVYFGILANPTIITEVINKNQFKITPKRTHIWGYINDRPLFWSPEIPRNVVYLIDRNIGTFIIKQDITMEIQEILSSEYEQVLKDIPSLKSKDLENMVRVKAYEIIYFKERDKYRNGVVRITMPESK